jgi:hypothetical protein
VPDDDPGPDHGDRHPARAEQVLDLTAAPQMGGEVVRVVAQAAQVDDAVKASPGSRLAEGGGPGGVHALEVRVLEGVHQVVRGLAAGHGRLQGGGVLYVTAHRPARPVVAGRLPGHGDHIVAGLLQGHAQPSADEAGRACYQNFQWLPRALRGRLCPCGQA